MNRDLILTAKNGSFPKRGTKAYKLLEFLSGGEPVPIDKCLLPEFGETLRSQLQTLRSDPYFWQIDRVKNDEGERCLQLHHAHLSKDEPSDCRVRCKRELKLRTISRDLAKSGTERLPNTELRLAIAKEKGSELQ